MYIPVDATLGEKIRLYRQAAGISERDLAAMCGISASGLRNYELGNRIPDFDTLVVIAENLRVSFYAIADVRPNVIDSAFHALMDMEQIYGLYPVEVDGHIQFQFKGSVSGDELERNPSKLFDGAGVMLEQMLRSFARAYAMHEQGLLTDDEFIEWKAKAPTFTKDITAWTDNRDKLLQTQSLPEPQKPKGKRRRKPPKPNRAKKGE